MATTHLDYAGLFAKNAPEGAAPWGGFPTYNFVGGHNNPETMPVEDFVESSARVLRQGRPKPGDLQHGKRPPRLHRAARFLVEKLAHYRGLRAPDENILITSGSNQGIELINEVLLEPGDTVVAELFTYQGVVGRWRKLQVNVVGIPLDEDGMRMDALASTLADLRSNGVRPKFIYTIPTLQNPTGTVLSMERRHEMLRLSREYGVPIFEDECYADLIWEGEWPPAICGLDDSHHVLHIGSFSKSLSPALRLGYVVAPWQVLSRMLACKTDGGTGALGQMVVADFFQNHYEEHMDKLRTSLKVRLQTLADALVEHFGSSVESRRRAAACSCGSSFRRRQTP